MIERSWVCVAMVVATVESVRVSRILSKSKERVLTVAT